MPNYHFSDDDARDVSAFILAQSTPLRAAAATAATPSRHPDPAAGTTLYGQSFCASCHAMQNAAGMMVGGNVGPELTGIGTKAKPEWLLDWVCEPGPLRSRHHDAALPLRSPRRSPRWPAFWNRRPSPTSSPTCISMPRLRSRSNTASGWCWRTVAPVATRSTASRSRRTSRRS